jgi:acetyl-CoA C-acetyltransferase
VRIGHAGGDHGREALAAGSVDLLIAGGMESMTNAPYLSLRHRAGARIGHDVLKDHMFLDGLEDAYEPGKLMGNFAEEVAQEYQFTRAAQDDFAIASLERAKAAQASGAFDREIVPVEVKSRARASSAVSLDEQPAKARPPRSRRSSRLSPRTARSPPPMPPRSRTAPRHW